jgi:predicted alpha/beta-hydrolase family hydrolase
VTEVAGSGGGARADLGLLLAPGAGADRTQAALVAVDEAVGALGVVVRRMDFPYRQAGRRAPDRTPVLLAAVRAEAAGLATGAKRLVLGGRSMGGRMCSMAVAEGLPAAGLVLISYPLHPPGRPDRSRTDHLPDLRVPSLWVSGTRDAFGTVAELEEATAVVPGPVTWVWIDGGDHGRRGRDARVAAVVADWVATTFL